uniref:Uncharacterized protein n=1 Tax=Arundo donax TaxID=35708 RepID=A0A0A9CHV6_ARUDO
MAGHKYIWQILTTASYSMLYIGFGFPFALSASDN